MIIMEKSSHFRFCQSTWSAINTSSSFWNAGQSSWSLEPASVLQRPMLTLWNWTWQARDFWNWLKASKFWKDKAFSIQLSMSFPKSCSVQCRKDWDKDLFNDHLISFIFVYCLCISFPQRLLFSLSGFQTWFSRDENIWSLKLHRCFWVIRYMSPGTLRLGLACCEGNGLENGEADSWRSQQKYRETIKKVLPSCYKFTHNDTILEIEDLALRLGDDFDSMRSNSSPILTKGLISGW